MIVQPHRLRHERHVSVDLAVHEQLDGIDTAVRGDPADVFLRVEPRVRGDERHELAWCRAARIIEPDLLAFQVLHGLDLLVRVQLEAAWVNAGERLDRHARLDPADEPARAQEAEVDLLALERLAVLGPALHEDMLNVGETLRFQQPLGHVRWRDAVRGIGAAADQLDLAGLAADSNRRDFGRAFVGEGAPGTENGCGAGR